MARAPPDRLAIIPALCDSKHQPRQSGGDSLSGARNIYFTSLDGGVVTVLKAGSAKPEVVAKNSKLGERVAATPAIADDALFIRTVKQIYAFAERK
jgi:hypothetical protein